MALLLTCKAQKDPQESPENPKSTGTLCGHLCHCQRRDIRSKISRALVYKDIRDTTAEGVPARVGMMTFRL